MATVSELLARKGKAVYTISKTKTVFEAISLMVAHNVGALVVLDGARPCGMITERDYLRKVALAGRVSSSTFVQEIMSDRLVHVTLDTAVEECMQLMTRARIRHLPVLSDSQLVGLVSIGDLVKFVAEARQQEIHQLTAYIQGSYS
ncbi:MAG TPA: CBS domain-containing protein [Polyangiaceae bacterium]|nr:CBS domain-containing protein [Polyangiaceae bacterium]